MGTPEDRAESWTDEALARLADEQRREREGGEPPAQENGEPADEDELEPDEGEEEPESEDEPRRYAGKFSSVEALEEAYRHAEQTIGRMGNELGHARRGGESDAPPPAQQQRPLPTREQLLEAYEEDPIAVIEY